METYKMKVSHMDKTNLTFRSFIDISISSIIANQCNHQSCSTRVLILGLEHKLGLSICLSGRGGNILIIK